MRDRETIDSELRLIANARRSMREQGSQRSCEQIDELLDERLGHRAAPSKPSRFKRVRSRLSPAPGCSATRSTASRLTEGKGGLRRFGSRAALPLSLVGVGAVLAVMFVVHNSHPAAQPTIVPPPVARPNPTAPNAPAPAAPTAAAPPLAIVDRAFIDVLGQVGVPVPSHEYVITNAHAVCDFLAHQPDFAEAVRFVQRSSIWDANQSTDFAAGAIVSYCPQYETTSSAGMQQAVQNALPDLRAIQGGLQGIQDDLQGIHGDLPAIPGQP
jgi:Protein of unknown function (DUF732)